ncbi:aspartate-semialdehyde dehydrogenase [candidate division KSB1 bacterium]|nr:aspartate-semialdehyde dehydrogenase [candidate division KSB1 bacterium]
MKNDKVNVAVVGVGAVGIEMLRVLRQRNFPINVLRVFARSAREIKVDGQTLDVEAIEGADYSRIEIALFAGTEGEKGAASLYADKFIKAGAVVIDNGADFRLKEDVPLIVPEANPDAIIGHKGFIANPNCNTIQAIVALAPIHREFGLNKFIVSSYQAASGAGKGAVSGLWEETKELIHANKDKDFDNIQKKLTGEPKGFSHQIAFNVIPQIGSPDKDGYTSEEWKMVHETHKILNDYEIKISSTCVRVPVFTSHSEAIYFTPRKQTSVTELEELLNASAGILYQSDELAFPLDAEGTDEVFVSRLRKDPSEENSYWLWCVADNLRKGAALNAVQIAELL